MADYPESYKLLWQKHIKELDSDVLMFEHIKTGAEVLVMQNDDENKVFSIGFRTVPPDSAGVTHILEHSVLSGSEKYPVKDPFVYLMKTSLKTFVNAFTYPEYTIYPVASPNHKDLENLTAVYLDAVFKPLLTEDIFKQEGWHYHLESKDAELEYKGVVFNEMKGSISAPSQVYWKEIKKALFPDNPYAHESGGSPEHIPNLTYQQLVDYHQTYYHPSNARVFMYGDGNIVAQLKQVAEYLDEYDRQEIDTKVVDQPGFKESVVWDAKYAVGEDSQDSKSYALTSWVLKLTSPKHRMMWHLLDTILTGSDAAPLRKALIDSDLGEGIAGWGFVSGLNQELYMVGLKGVEEQDVDKVHQLIGETLAKMAEQIDPQVVEAAINSTEFGFREINTGGVTGMEIFDWVIESWYLGGDPLELVQFADLITEIREDYQQNPQLFSDLIQQELVENHHRVDLAMRPDPDLISQRAKQEQQQLQKVRSGLSEEQIDELVEETKKIAEWSSTPDSQSDLAKIPQLQVADLPIESKKIPTSFEKSPEYQNVVLPQISTRGISYFNLAFDISWLEPEQVPYLSVLLDLLTRLGTQQKSYTDLALEVDTHTGGIWTGVLIDNKYQSQEQVSYALLSGKCFEREQTKLVELMREILADTDLNHKQRVQHIMQEQKASFEASITYNGSQLANNRAQSQISSAYKIHEGISGLDNYYFLTELLKDFDSKWEQLVTKLLSLQQGLVNSRISVNYSGTQTGWKQQRELISGIFGDGSAATDASLSELDLSRPVNEGFIIPSDVNYVAYASDLGEVGYQFDGTLLATRRLLSADYLWTEIRMKGGAYGARFDYDMYTGTISASSYRDPNIAQTLDVYRKMGEYLQTRDLTKQDIDGAIIGAVGMLDAPLVAASKSWTAFSRHLLGLSDEARQQTRDELLATQLKDIREFGEVLVEAAKQHPVVTVLGNKSKLEMYNESAKQQLQLKPLI